MTTFPKLSYYCFPLLLILLFRASLDPVFGLFRLGPFSFGAVLNLFILLILIILTWRADLRLRWAFMSWLPLIVILLISILYTPYVSNSIRSTLGVITFMAFFLIPFHFIRSNEHFVECIKVIVYSSFIPLVAVSYEFIFPAGSTNQNGFRLFSTFSHPNIFAFYLVTVVSVCFFSIKSELFKLDINFRKLCWVVLVLSLVCILGTKTRSAWASIALLILLYGIFQERKYLLYLCIAASMAMLVPSIQERVFDLFQGNDTDAFINDFEALNSYAWRKVIWAGAMEAFWQNPVLGFGYESFTFYSGSFFLIESETGAGAHNTYVQLLFEIGVVGFIAFLWLLVPTLLLLWKYKGKSKENIIVFGLFLTYCLIHYSDNIFDYLVFNWYFWFFIGSFLAYQRLTQQNCNPPENRNSFK